MAVLVFSNGAHMNPGRFSQLLLGHCKRAFPPDSKPFYDDVLDTTLNPEGPGEASWLMEYAWNVSPLGPHCDPCPPESLEIPVPEATLAGLGFEWDAGDSWSGGLPSFTISRLRMRYSPDQINEDLMLYSMGYVENT